MTGAVPPPARQRGRCLSDLGVFAPRDACLQPSYAQASSLKGWPRNLYRVALLPLEVSLQHRPGPPHTMPTGSGGLGPEVTPKGFSSPHVVRIAPLHDAGHHHGRRPCRDLYFCGRSYTLMHAEELRAGHVHRPRPMNAACVHDLFRFVKTRPFTPSLSKHCPSSCPRS